MYNAKINSLGEAEHMHNFIYLAADFAEFEIPTGPCCVDGCVVMCNESRTTFMAGRANEAVCVTRE